MGSRAGAGAEAGGTGAGVGAGTGAAATLNLGRLVAPGGRMFLVSIPDNTYNAKAMTNN